MEVIGQQAPIFVRRMNPILRKTVDQIRWHQVADFDLDALCTSPDAEVARLAKEEKERRQPSGQYTGESLFSHRSEAWA